ncbi:MAG: M1 family aminopeptidase [Candidatus Marinimicrobia bacterium]|nr:M1 family aminopeptidase [Candidatus Neomarinimicrobiota bacterium]
MKRTCIIIILSIIFSSCEKRSLDTSPGVSWQLAEHRSATISDVRYKITLSIPEKVNEPIMGSETIQFLLSETGQEVVLDFRQPAEYIHSVKMNGKPMDYIFRDQHIIMEDNQFSIGENQIDIVFRAGDMSLNRNDEFLYTLFVPDRAATAIPCFDQPNLKGRYTLTLHTPSDWAAIANGPLLDEIEKDGQRTFHFGETRPVSTYILAFVAGKFQKISASRNGRLMTMLHRETDSAKVARNTEAIFDLHADAIAWLEEYTGIDYPFQKFDFALIPVFQYGGMEHPGAIFYKDSGLFLDESATKSQYLGRAGLIAHETAHMWFGDLVTMSWFDDVWTKEVFAGFMGGKIVNPAFPEINHDLRFLSNYSSAYGVDRSLGPNQIRQPLENLNMAGTLYGSIIYAKAPVVMKHLELLVGEETFQKGMQKYLGEFSYGNATWPELIEIMDELSEEDLASWSKVWVDEPDRPIIEMDLKLAPDGSIRRLKLKQKDPGRKNRVWGQRLKVRLGYADEDKVISVYLKNRSVNLAEAKGLPRPDYILPNGEGIGYGFFRMNADSREYLSKHLPEIDDPFIRGIAWLNLWDDMLYGHTSPADMIYLAVRSLKTETDILNIQRTLGRIRSTYWNYITHDQRIRMAPDLESIMKGHLDEAETVSLRSSYFRTLRSIILSDNGYKWLKGIWTETDSIPGLKFSERDFIAMATELALRGKRDSPEILTAQLNRINNPDRKARFKFVIPSLSNDILVRDQFFESLKKEENRAREPWAGEAVRHLHHPLRALSSEKYIRVSLELLEEIQRTGDIFFPARWVSATLSGHQSVSAANIVNQFLEDHPNYSPRLKLKILQAADGLFRAVEILNQ